MPLLLALAAIVALVLPASASAGSLTKRDRGGVSKALTNRLHLTTQERRALDIASVQVTGKEVFGVVVDVRFKGNVERRIGRGHLKRAAIALVLEPRSRRAKSTVIVTQGAGRQAADSEEESLEERRGRSAPGAPSSSSSRAPDSQASRP